MSEYERLVHAAEKSRLSQSLSATMRAALAASDAELATWTRLELLGYKQDNPAMSESVTVPQYRTVSGQWFDDYGRVFVVEDPRLNMVNETRLRAGVGELEGFIGAKGVISIRLDSAEIIREHLGVSVSVFRFGPHSVEQVLVNIRAQLLDRLAIHRPQLDTAPAAKASGRGEDVVLLRPSLYGIGLDLRALFRRWRAPKP